MRAFAVAFLADYFVSWMGGASLLGFVVNGVMRAAAAQNTRVHVLLSAQQLPEALRREVRDFLPLPRAQLDAEGPLACLLDNLPALELVLFYRDLDATLDALGVDVIGPTGQDLGTQQRRPWFAYVPDFQHQHLPRFFTQRERQSRDGQFRALLENSAGLFVNSGTVVADLERFYGAAARSARVLRLPQVYPDLDGAFGDREAEVRTRYGLARPYLLSCSQRWLHKQHEVLVAAFAEHRARNPRSALQLVFTGERSDYRDPAYADAVDALVAELGLTEHVRHVGLVPRADQLQLIRGARALLQASLFEGGPGASGTLEAALLGVPVVASDIGANRELQFGQFRFFEAGQPKALARELERFEGEGVEAARREPVFDAEQIEFLRLASGLQTIAALRSAAA